jgi:hypothetical protein
MGGKGPAMMGTPYSQKRGYCQQSKENHGYMVLYPKNLDNIEFERS